MMGWRERGRRGFGGRTGSSRRAAGRGKVSGLQAREWPERIRQGWSKECNRALERAGREERIDPRTLAEQARAALKKGDLDQAAELARTPEPKRGAGDAIQRRYEGGQAPEPSRAVAAWKRGPGGEWKMAEGVPAAQSEGEPGAVGARRRGAGASGPAQGRGFEASQGGGPPQAAVAAPQGAAQVSPYQRG